MASASSGASSPASDDVGFIMEQCSCSRRKAASALKLHKGDRDAAVKSLQDSVNLTSPLGGASPSSRPLSPAGPKTKAGAQPGPSILSPAPHSYYQVPKFKGLLPARMGADPTLPKQTSLPPPPDSLAELSIPFRQKDAAAAEEATEPGSGLSARIPSIQLPVVEPEGTVDGFPCRVESWDFRLPVIEIPIGEPPFSPDEGRRLSFSLVRLIATLGRGLSSAQLQHYLLFFDERVVHSGLNASISGIPSVFYAVATNDESIVRTWAAHGTNMNTIEPKTGIPLLAFAIMRTRAANEDTTSMLMTLLSLGADATVIPGSLFSPCLDDPAEELSRYGVADPKVAWCNEKVYTLMARTINLSQRYFLDKVLHSQAPTNRQSQVTRIHNATALLGVSHFLIGQTAATQLVSDVLISHLALPRTKPLVMAFTGPSGHGKTELAKRMGELLNLEICCVDCTEMKHETDLFGPKRPFLGYELGSPLNNFLTRNTGKRCIVFLDELEKTTREVQNALLVPFSEGRYSDRRNREAVDTSQTIWIFATNAADDVILDFFQIHEHHLSATNDPMNRSKLIMQLTMSIKKQLKSTYGNPLSGRISVIVPFLPFTPVEAAVVAHKFVLEFKRRVLQSIRLEGRQLVGHVALEMLGDGAICKLIAEEGYDCDQGARSLQTSVETRIGDATVRAYLEEESQIDDALPLTKYIVSVARNGNMIVRRADPAVQGEQEDLYSAEELSRKEIAAAPAAAGDTAPPSGLVECEQEQPERLQVPARKKTTDTKKGRQVRLRAEKGPSSKEESPKESPLPAKKENNVNQNAKVRGPESSRKVHVGSESGEGSGSDTDVPDIPPNDHDKDETKAKEGRIKLLSSILKEFPKEQSDRQIQAAKEWRKGQEKAFPNLFKNFGSSEPEDLEAPPADLRNGVGAVLSGFVGGTKQQLQQLELVLSALERRSLTEEQQRGMDNVQLAMRSVRRNTRYAEEETSSFLDVLGLAEKMLRGPAADKMMGFNSQTADEKASNLEDLRSELAGIVPKLLGKDSPFAKDMDHAGIMGGGMLLKHMQPFLEGQIMADPRNMATGPPPLKEYDIFRYAPLGSTPSIRLLSFEDEADGNPCLIKLRMKEVALGSDPDFNAVSYVWGDHRPPLLQQFNTKRSQWRFSILCNEQRIEVTYNLFCCLRRLSMAEGGPLGELRRVPFWIDQLCINQSDTAEKGQQVAMMDQIYTAAQSVVSWLGEGGTLASGATGLIDQLSKVPMDLIKSPDFDPVTFVAQFSGDDWLSLGSIMARPYFKRVWIVQEIALAKKLLLVCGDQLLDWDRLTRALEVINASQAWPQLSEYVLVFRPPEEQIPSLGMRSPLRFGDELSTLVEAQRASRGSGLTPADLLFLGRRFDATQIVDKFFAMVGMAKRGAQTPTEAAQLPSVDYSLSLKDVALHFATYYITHLGGATLLSLVEDAKYKTDMGKSFPSWLPDPAAPLLPTPLKAEGLRFDAATSWRACGDLLETEPPRIDNDSLLLRGFRLDAVDKTAMPFNLIDSTDEWHRLFDFIGEVRDDVTANGFSVGQVLWRTLTTSFDRASAKGVATAGLDKDFANWCVSLIVSIERHYIRTLGSSASADFMTIMHRSEDLQFDVRVFGNSIKTYLEQDLASELLSSNSLRHHVMNTRFGESESVGDEMRPDRVLRRSLEALWSQTGEDDVFPSRVALDDALDLMHETRRETAVYKAAFDSVGRFEKALRKNLHSRTLFVTADGRLGMGPHSVAHGDEIWILPGASTPFIFRGDGHGSYTLVGEAFVFGVMHGEAVLDVDAVTLERITVR